MEIQKQKTFLNGGKFIMRNGKGFVGYFLGVIHFLASQSGKDIIRSIKK